VANAEHLLLPGMYGRIAVATGASAPSAVQSPYAVCTCSTIGGLAEAAGASMPDGPRVLRIDRAMAEVTGPGAQAEAGEAVNYLRLAARVGLTANRV